MVRRQSGRPERKSDKLANRRLDRLSSTVNDLFSKATQNEKILRRYQQFELKLLDLAGFESLLDMLIRNSVDYFQLDCAELWLYDPQSTLSGLLPEEYLYIPHLRLLPVADEFVALYGHQPTVRLLSVDGVKKLPVFKEQALHSAALLPLVRHGVIVGSLHFGAKGGQRFTDDKSTDFIAHLASVVSVCLENAVNQDRLHRLSMFDMLTQVKNRRAFQQALEEEVSRAARSGDSLSLLFVDLDHFKQINDNYGHPMGDRVLKEVAQHINTMLRKTDHVCRYGGEEFALVLPNCSRRRAMEIAERIRQQISELLVADDKGVSVSVTLSIGVSGWYAINRSKDSGNSERCVAKQLIACSDKGVYLAKAAGRNIIHYVKMKNSELSDSRAGFYETVAVDHDTVDFELGIAGKNKVGAGHLDSRRNDVWPEMVL